MPRAGGGLERAIADMTIGVQRHRDARRKQLSYTAGTEMEQQIRVPLAGEAENGWGYFDKGVGFKFPFIWLPGQRGAPFKTPQFSYGIEHLSGTNQLVLIHASIIKWNIDSSSRVTGAKVRYAASAPMLGEGEHSTNFSAVAHLTFQGWACSTEEGEV
jgi:hypothetical protein